MHRAAARCEASVGHTQRTVYASVVLPSFTPLATPGAHPLGALLESMQALRLLTISILGILLTLATVRWDRKRLGEDQRARSWNSATLGQALLNFGPWSMLGWGWVTRRWKGLLLGIFAASLITLVLVIVDAIFIAVFGE